MLSVPRIEDKSARGVGRQICKWDETAARNGDEGSQCAGRAAGRTLYNSGGGILSESKQFTNALLLAQRTCCVPNKCGQILGK